MKRKKKRTRLLMLSISASSWGSECCYRWSQLPGLEAYPAARAIHLPLAQSNRASFAFAPDPFLQLPGHVSVMEDEDAKE